jgi:hypothetical protein
MTVEKHNFPIWDIVGTGKTATNWKQHDYSIGVNDCWKLGKPTDALLVCNRPEQFSRDRFEIIKNSTPKEFYSHKSNWSEYFPKWKKLNLVQFYGQLNPNQVYSSGTSTFIALSLAYNLGAKNIVMWGCDLIDHHLWNNNNPQTKREVEAHLELIKLMNEKGVEVYLGANGTAFDEHLKVYEEGFIRQVDQIQYHG